MSIVWIPKADPLGRIAQFPAMVAELRQLNGTRNPDGDNVGSHTVPGPKPPCNETVVFILDDRENSHWGGLHSIQNVSQTVWEYLPSTSAHPRPEMPSWAAECAWLVSALPEAWQNMPDPILQTVLDMIDATWTSLAHAIGLQPPKRWPCLTDGCQGAMHVTSDGWLECTNGHHHQGLDKWRFHPAMTLDQLAAEFNIKRNTLEQWHRRGWLPYRDHVKPVEAWPWDVVRRRWPDLAQLIDDRRAAS